VPAVATAATGTPAERAHVRARAALDRALALVHGHTSDPRSGTIVLRDLRLQLAALTPAERATARAILARPSDGRSGDWTAPKSSFKHVCTTHFCIHWVKKTVDAPSLKDGNHNGRPDYIDSVISVMSTVWKTEVVKLGYRAPLGDAGSGAHRGGNPNGKIDIFIQDIGDQGYYGYCTTDDPRFGQRSDVSAYCVFDDDFSKKQFRFGAHGIAALKVTAAHEFNHAIQFAYDVREDRWLLEATATNMEATVFPSIPDNYQYLPSSPLSKTRPWVSIDSFQPQGTNQYGVWIFFHFLCEKYGNCDIVRDIWNRAAAVKGTKNGQLYSTQAVEQAIANQGDTFADVFRQFGVANQDPAVGYTEGAAFGSSAKVRNYANNPMDAGFVYSYGLGTLHMANDYVRLVPGTGATTVDLSFDLPALPGAQVTVIRYDQTGSPQSPQVPVLNANGDGVLNGVSFSSANTQKLVVVFTNASTSFSCNHGTNYSCHGLPLGDSSSPDYSFDATVS